MHGHGTGDAGGADAAGAADTGDVSGGGGGGGGGGGDGATGGFALTELEIQAKTHAILCTIGFLILLPLGVLIARYTRTLTARWFFAHWIVQLFISGPIIFAGWAMGYMTTNQLEQPHFIDPHQKIGLALLIMYLIQLFVGAIVHFFKFHSLFRGYRAPHNYFHVFLGLAIIALASFQVHYGLFTEWAFATGGLHVVPLSAKHTWMALLIVFWALYGIGMALLPRQFKQERQFRQRWSEDRAALNNKTEPEVAER